MKMSQQSISQDVFKLFFYNQDFIKLDNKQAFHQRIISAVVFVTLLGTNKVTSDPLSFFDFLVSSQRSTKLLPGFAKSVTLVVSSTVRGQL